MSIHLHDVIEQLNNGMLASTSPKPINIAAIIRRFRISSESAICFHCGDAHHTEEFRIIAELVKLPYPTCWFEFHTQEGDAGVLCEYDEDCILGGIVFFKRPAWKEWCFTGFGYFQNNGIVTDAEQQESVQTVVFASLCMVASFLSALNCSNVKRTEHSPSQKLQKARLKRGKQPLFSFWTLELPFERNEKGEPLGGTHASPRVHLRRGHVRQYAVGKWTWVQPCAVGNKAIGIIHKDYKTHESIRTQSTA